MKLTLSYTERLSQWTREELQRMVAIIGASWNVNHKATGEHGTIDSDDIYQHARPAAVGEWFPLPYAATNFATLGGGTWTVLAADVQALSAELTGATMDMTLTVAMTVVTGAPTALVVSLPAGYLALGTHFARSLTIYDAGAATYVAGIAAVTPGYGFLILYRPDLAAWAAGTYTIFGGLRFEVIG